jgi:SAM-dependent methyltransferase
VYGIELLRFFSQIAPKGKKSFLECAKILDAGCGTGNTATQIARQFPSSRVYGVDLVSASINVAKENGIRKGVNNIQFLIENILTMELGETFDVILNIGVLHHLSAMSLGLSNLARHLADDGFLVLWLYGKYGRYRLNLNQRMLRIVFANVDSLPRKVHLTKKALSLLPRQYTGCHFNAPDSMIEDDFEKSLEFAFKNEAWLVDQFLHVNEKTVSMDEILALFEQNRLRLTAWLSGSEDMDSYCKDDDIMSMFRTLDRKSRLLVLDLLLKPNYYLLIAQKDVGGQP